jgi:hypothetical protein
MTVNETIETIAADALKTAEGDLQEATAAMAKKISAKKNAELYRALMDPLVRRACYDKIAEIGRQERERVWNQPSLETVRDAIAALAAGTRKSLMAFTLPGGRRLGDALREDVTRAAQFYVSQSADMAVKGRWLYMIAKALKAGQKVADAMTEEKLLTFKMKAERNLSRPKVVAANGRHRPTGKTKPTQPSAGAVPTFSLMRWRMED